MLLPTLETDRLKIRPLTANDLSVCHQLYLDTRWAEKGLTDEQNLQIRRGWLDWTIRNYAELDRLNQPPYGDRAVELRENSQLIGLVVWCLCSLLSLSYRLLAVRLTRLSRPRLDSFG
jgi:hypothetical protein